ncbi:MAG: hypothetical protein ACRCVN_07195, partial [Spirochaetia bacterium]
MIKLRRLCGLLVMMLLMTSCASSPAIMMLPVPPETPALRHPEQMDRQDAQDLAHFYQDYEVFRKKLE